MKRIYISFFTTIFVALFMTMIAFVTRKDIQHVVRMDKNTHDIVQDSTLNSLESDSETFN